MRLLIKFSFTIILLSACSKYSFTPLYPPPPPGYYDNVTLGTVYNGNLIVAGSFTTLFNSSRYIAQWNGTTWQNLGSGLGSYYGTGGVNTFAVYNNNLIVGGYFDSAGGQIANRIALWNGSSWQTLGSGMTTSSRNNNPHVGALAVYNGNLIAAGNFLYAGGVSASNIASWNGSAWQSLQGGTDIGYYDYPYINSLTVYNGNLIAGGVFDSIGKQPIRNLAQWNGATWSSIGGKCNNSISNLIVYNGNLIAEGSFDTIGGIPAQGVAQWNGTTWSALSNTMYTSVIYNGNFYGYTNGFIRDSLMDEWSPTSGINAVIGACSSTKERYYQPMGSFMNPLCVYNGNLIVGGWFTSIDGINTSNLAQWNGSNWSAF